MKKSVLLAACLIFFILAQASHNRSGEILYKRTAPFSSIVGGINVEVFTYSITVIKYTDSGPSIADRCVDTVYFGDGTKGVALRVNGTNTCGCNSSMCGDLIVNTVSYVVKENIYKVTHTYPGDYIIRSTDPNRTSGIHNIPNSLMIPFSIEAKMSLTANMGLNSSPAFMHPPTDQATMGICFSVNHGAYDNDGDSLSFAFTPCLNAPGFFYPEFGQSGHFDIGATNGLIDWCYPQFQGLYNFAYKVFEWRKNSLGTYQNIGYTERDMEVIVKYGVLGINNYSAFKDLNIYPNPFNTELQIELSQTSNSSIPYQVYSMEGALLTTSTAELVDGIMNLPLKDLKQGLYLIELQQGNERIYRKIAKN